MTALSVAREHSICAELCKLRRNGINKANQLTLMVRVRTQMSWNDVPSQDGGRQGCHSRAHRTVKPTDASHSDGAVQSKQSMINSNSIGRRPFNLV